MFCSIKSFYALVFEKFSCQQMPQMYGGLSVSNQELLQSPTLSQDEQGMSFVWQHF